MEGAYERVVVPYRNLVGLIYTHCWPKAYRWMINTLFLCVFGLCYPSVGVPGHLHCLWLHGGACRRSMYVLCTISELELFIRGPPKATGHGLGWLRCTSKHVHWFRSVAQGPGDPTNRCFGGWRAIWISTGGSCISSMRLHEPNIPPPRSWVFGRFRTR